MYRAIEIFSQRKLCLYTALPKLLAEMKTKIYIEKKGKFAGDVKIEILPPSDKNHETHDL